MARIRRLGRRTGSGGSILPKLGSAVSPWARLAEALCALCRRGSLPRDRIRVIPGEGTQAQHAHERDGEHTAEPRLDRESAIDGRGPALALHLIDVRPTPRRSWNDPGYLALDFRASRFPIPSAARRR